MNLHAPLFYSPNNLQPGIHPLDESTARHVGLVLRMTAGEQLMLTDGQGRCAEATLSVVSKKAVLASIVRVTEQPHALPQRVAVGIAPTKNTSRLEWFLEKAGELGVRDIFLLQTTRTEKSHLRMDRLQQVLVGAMLQSQQYHLPMLHPLQPLSQVLEQATARQRAMAHCMPGEKLPLATWVADGAEDLLVLIGPEGDFTPDEWNLAQQHGYTAVSLGQTRLRTETAAMVAAAICCQVL